MRRGADERSAVTSEARQWSHRPPPRYHRRLIALHLRFDRSLSNEPRRAEVSAEPAGFTGPGGGGPQGTPGRLAAKEEKQHSVCVYKYVQSNAQRDKRTI